MAAMPEAVIALKAVEAAELKRGGLYLLRLKGHVSGEVMEGIKVYFDCIRDRHDVEFVLLDDTFEIVRAAEVGDVVRRVIAEGAA